MWLPHSFFINSHASITELPPPSPTIVLRRLAPWYRAVRTIGEHSGDIDPGGDGGGDGGEDGDAGLVTSEKERDGGDGVDRHGKAPVSTLWSWTSSLWGGEAERGDEGATTGRVVMMGDASRRGGVEGAEGGDEGGRREAVTRNFTFCNLNRHLKVSGCGGCIVRG